MKNEITVSEILEMIEEMKERAMNEATACAELGSTRELNRQSARFEALGELGALIKSEQYMREAESNSEETKLLLYKIQNEFADIFFDSLEEATQYASDIFKRTGCVMAIEEVK